MQFSKLFSRLFSVLSLSLFLIGSLNSQVLVVQPQVPGGLEGGEILLSGTNSAPRGWHLDQFNNQFRIHSNGQVPMYIENSNFANFTTGIKTRSLLAVPTSNVEGGEITLLGGGNHNGWSVDNFAGSLRMFHSNVVYLTLNQQGALILNSADPVEGGEITLASGNGNINIDNYNGTLRFFKHGGGIFQFTPAGNASLSGKFECRAIKVTTTPTADFVFADNYQVRSLEATEAFIKQYRHLPEIASAKEMEKDGLNIADFQIQLLQKIEELTLYTIEQDKQIKALKAENKRYQDLLERIEKLEANN